MGTYRAPVEDMNFLIDEVLDAENALGTLPDFADYGVGSELTTALLDEAAKLAGDELAPLRRVGDEQPAICTDGAVTTPPGYDAALRQLAEGGWIGISSDPRYGGQGLPEIYNTVGHEMWNGANMALGLAPMLSSGAALAREPLGWFSYGVVDCLMIFKVLGKTKNKQFWVLYQVIWVLYVYGVCLALVVTKSEAQN